jgi:riboflavin synthase
VTKRLGEITVDPKTVTLAKKVEVSSAAPKPVAGLVAGTLNYAGTIAAGTQNIPITMSQTTKEEGGAWVVDATAKVNGQEMSDSTSYAKGSLILVKRTIKQGPVVIEIAFADQKATGSMAMGAAPKPFTADLGGDLFADGAGSHESIACLPLAEGYTATFRNFDVQKQKASLKQIKVTGSEEVKVPGGTFQAWKVEQTSADGEPGSTTLWIDKASRKVVKISAVLANMGGAVLTTELQ